MKSLRTLLLGAIVPALLTTAAGSRAHAQTAPQPTDEYVLRTYEVGDLVVKVPDYAADPADGGSGRGRGGGAMGGSGFGSGSSGMGGGGGGFFSVPDQGSGGAAAGVQFVSSASPADPMQITFDSLLDALVGVVAPNTWTDNGGGDGQVRVVGAALVVWQTPEVHERIADFLEQLRQGSATRRTVTVDARWLLLDSDDLEQLVGTTEDGRAEINRDVLAQFTRRPGSLRGITNCFSGQSVYLISGTRRNVVRSYIPVVGSVDRPSRDAFRAMSFLERSDVFQLVADVNEGDIIDQFGNPIYAAGGRSVGYQPVVETPNFGASLRIRPTLMDRSIRRQNAAVVDLTWTITFPSVDTGAGLDAPMPAGPAPRVDRLAIDTQELATTLRVPLGEPVLVGGMSHIVPQAASTNEASGDALPPAERGETPQLYLVLEVR